MNAIQNQRCKCESPIDAGFRRSGCIVCARCDGIVGVGLAIDLPEFIDGKRIINSHGDPTNAGYRELRIREIMVRGADRERAEILAEFRVVKSKRGTLAAERNGMAYTLSREECVLLGREPGPGNN